MQQSISEHQNLELITKKTEGTAIGKEDLEMTQDEELTNEIDSYQIDIKYPEREF